MRHKLGNDDNGYQIYSFGRGFDGGRMLHANGQIPKTDMPAIYNIPNWFYIT